MTIQVKLNFYETKKKNKLKVFTVIIKFHNNFQTINIFNYQKKINSFLNIKKKRQSCIIRCHIIAMKRTLKYLMFGATFIPVSHSLAHYS